MHNYSTYNTSVLTLCLIVAAGIISGCGGGGGDQTTSAPVLEELSLSGSVGDGPITNADITVYDKNGNAISTFGSDANANYDIIVKVPGNAYPLVLESINGVDLVTNLLPDMTLKSVAWKRNKTVNLNPFSTLAVETAIRMAGGLTDANVNLATSRILGNYGFGLDATINPITTPINDRNIASIIKASEALGEVIRRSRDALSPLGEFISGDEVIAALAADLAGNDAVINAVGMPGSDKRIADVVNTVAAQVLVEALSNNLRVNNVVATTAMNNAILVSMPSAPASATTGNVRITQQMLNQLNSALQVARQRAPSATLDNILNIVDGISANSLPPAILPVLPPELSLELNDAINVATAGSGSQATPPESTATPDTETPTVPQNLSATAVSSTQVNLSWDASTDFGGAVAGYKVYRTGIQIATVGGRSYSDTTVAPNTIYNYRVSAFDDAVIPNDSAWTSPATVTTPIGISACTGVDIEPQFDAVAIVDANPAGTTFCFKEGIHYLTAPIHAHTNDKFIGDSGAILDGNNTIVQAIWGYGGDGGQKNVTVRGFIIQNFRTDWSVVVKRAAIKAGSNWIVEDNEIRYNYDVGVLVGRGTILRNNHIHHNGRYGIVGGPGLDMGVVIDGNELSYNNTRGVHWAISGGSKIVGSKTGTTGVTWVNNWIHHNNGHGIFNDGNVGPGIDIGFNLIEDNEGIGILHEISWGVDIHDNTFINNAKQYAGKSCWHGAQIHTNNSVNVNIYKNHIESTEGANGVCMADSVRGEVDPFPVTVSNSTVTDNTIKLVGNAQNGLVGDDYPSYDTSNAFFDRNIYYLPDPDGGAYWRLKGLFTRAEWEAAGQDLGSTFIPW